MTEPRVSVQTATRPAPIPCGCTRHADGWLCYRCRQPLCNACAKQYGGWCRECCDDVLIPQGRA
jgi:hypothetical protein